MLVIQNFNYHQSISISASIGLSFPLSEWYEISISPLSDIFEYHLLSSIYFMRHNEHDVAHRTFIYISIPRLYGAPFHSSLHISYIFYTKEIICFYYHMILHVLWCVIWESIHMAYVLAIFFFFIRLYFAAPILMLSISLSFRWYDAPSGVGVCWPHGIGSSSPSGDSALPLPGGCFCQFRWTCFGYSLLTATYILSVKLSFLIILPTMMHASQKMPPCRIWIRARRCFWGDAWMPLWVTNLSQIWFDIASSASSYPR